MSRVKHSVAKVRNCVAIMMEEKYGGNVKINMEEEIANLSVEDIATLAERLGFRRLHKLEAM